MAVRYDYSVRVDNKMIAVVLAKCINVCKAQIAAKTVAINQLQISNDAFHVNTQGLIKT